ncbi:MAG: Uma2 family endonuclease [Geothrix sp.]|nr:Uma2 family endonuclease [Geothrix sp.]
MSLPRLKHPGYTIEDWKLWDGRWEIINGVAYDMTPAPSPDHQRIASRLHVALVNALEEARLKPGGGECETFFAPIDVFLDSGIVQPDLLVVCDPAKISTRGIEGAPDLVVEILSPSTAGKDVTRKRWTYEAAGVPEYLIVDPDERVGLLLNLAGGRYEEAARVEWGAVVALLGGKVTVTLG